MIGKTANSRARDLSSNLSLYLSYWAENPVAFVIQAFQGHKYGYPCQWQADALNNLRDYKKVAIASGHGVGKSRLLSWAAWWMLICKKKPGFPLKIPVTGPSGSNLEDILWAELGLVRGHLHPFLASMFCQQNDKLYCIDERDEERDPWFARLRTSRQENPSALQGFHGDPSLYVIDEFSGVPDNVFEVARGAMSDENSYAIMCGNPVRLSGYGYEMFHAESTVWKTMYVNCEDNLTTAMQHYSWVGLDGEINWIETKGRVSAEYVAGMRDEYGERSPTYKARVLGQFPTTEDDVVVPQDLVTASKARDPWTAGPWFRAWGVDVADRGRDESTLCKRWGPQVEDILGRHSMDTDDIVDWVAGEYDDAVAHGVAPRWICVDAIGVGAGVYSGLMRRKIPVIPVYSGDASPNTKGSGTQCRRLRDWLWWQARLWFQHKKPVLRGEGKSWGKLRQELAMPMYAPGATGKIEVEDKKSIRKRRKGKSTDYADALVMTFIVRDDGVVSESDPVDKRNKGPRKHHRRKQHGGVNKKWMTY
jgi:hypothetical protein